MFAPQTAGEGLVPGVASRETKGGAGLGHAGLLPWNLACGKATAPAAGVLGKWVSRSFHVGEATWVSRSISAAWLALTYAPVTRVTRSE